MKVFFSVAVLLLCMQAALGFMPAAPKARCGAIKMSAAPENKAVDVVKQGKQALAGLMTPLLLAAPALATEGTGEVREHLCFWLLIGFGAGLTSIDWRLRWSIDCVFG